MNSVSNNREEIGAALATIGVLIWMHDSPGWDATVVQAMQGAITVIAVWLVGFFPQNTGVTK